MRDPIVQLPATFVQNAPCAGCGELVRIGQPEWVLSNLPLCINCGGAYSRTKSVPEQHGTLSVETSKELMNLSLDALGIGPGLHLFVAGRDEVCTVRIAGSCEDVIQILEDQDD